MKSYRGLIIRYLKSQRKRSLLTILGIILSVSLLTAAGIMGESLKNLLLDSVKQRFGDFHVAYSQISDAQLNMLQKNVKVDRVGLKIDVGAVQGMERQKVMIMGCERTFLDMNHISLASGKIPSGKDEIMLEKWIAENMKNKPHVGDTVALEFSSVSGYKPGSEKSGSPPETKRNFKLTGIYKNTNASQSTGVSYAMTTLDTARDILGGGADGGKVLQDAFITVKKNLPLQTSIEEVSGNLGLPKEQVHQNTAVLTAMGSSRDDRSNRAIMSIQWIMIAVIIIATVAVIYNSFHIAVLERIRQFGLLRSIGTTPKQIRIIVMGEAAILSVLGIPPGLICGVLGVKSVIGIFALRSSDFFGGMTVIVPGNILILAALLGLVTVFVSAFLPALSAGRVSPLEAILRGNKINMARAKRRKHPVLKGLFRVEGVMAYENLKRNRKRFYVTIFSMCIGIMLFIFFSTFVGFMNSEMENYFQKDFAVERPFSSDREGYSLGDYNEIAGIDGVRTVYRLMQKNMTALITDDKMTDRYKEAVKDRRPGMQYEYEGARFNGLAAMFYGYRDMELKMCRSHVIKGGINTAAMDAQNGVLVSQKVMLDSGDKLDASQLKVGDEIRVISSGQTSKTGKPVVLKVMGILDKMPLVYNGSRLQFGIITTENVFKKVTGVDTFARFDIELERNNDGIAIKQQLNEISKKFGDGFLMDFTQNSGKEVQTELMVILYGLVTVISIIGAINIINTISTNLILRTREFGILRAVGMTPGQMKGMIRLEGIFYGIIATFYGSVIGCLLARFMYNSLNMVQQIPWHYPWRSIAAAGMAAMAIGLASTAVPMKRISRMNVVESIKAEE